MQNIVPYLYNNICVRNDYKNNQIKLNTILLPCSYLVCDNYDNIILPTVNLLQIHSTHTQNKTRVSG